MEQKSELFFPGRRYNKVTHISTFFTGKTVIVMFVLISSLYFFAIASQQSVLQVTDSSGTN
jgi:hypothetical protein